MLLRKAETFRDEVTGQLERVFPMDSDWLDFESMLPASDVLRDTVLDPAIGLADEISRAAFANADWSNFVRSLRVATFELSTRIGLPAIDQLPVNVNQIFTQLSTSLANVDNMSTSEMIEDVLKTVGAAAVSAIALSTSVVGLVVAAVLAAAMWIIDVVASAKEAALGKTVTLPPMQTADPATDSWQVNRIFELMRLKPSKDAGAVLPDGSVVQAGNADLTPFFLPAYKGAWTFAWREKGLVAQQGSPSTARGPGGQTEYPFDVGTGVNFGFMPGTDRMLRTLQASYRFYQPLRGDVGVDRYNLRCNDRDRGCGQSVKAFDGSKDCRQCVKRTSVWPFESEGLGSYYGGLPFNVTTPGENTGEFHLSTNKLLLTLLTMIIGEAGSGPKKADANPLKFCVDVEQMLTQWKATFEGFWEWMPGAWTKYRGVGWKCLLTRLQSFMVAFDWQGEPMLGGRVYQLPEDVICNPRTSAQWDLSFKHSVYSKIIEPFCLDLVADQRRSFSGVECAYVPPLAAAVFTSTGKIRKNELGQMFEDERRELLQSSARMSVDLRLVTDKEYRDALIDSGVKPSPVKAGLLPGPPELKRPKPPRARKPPRLVTRVPPGQASNDLVSRSPGRRRPGVGRGEPEAEGDGAGVAAIVLGGTLVVGLGALGLWYVNQR